MIKKSVFNLPQDLTTLCFTKRTSKQSCSSEAEVREQIRRTVIHELGYYFGMDENQLKDV
jgi:predicted Zn-dependent protease with MMP-like domain